MGFGHRVYKNYDPRAALVKASAREVLDDLGARDELLELAQELEAVALSDDYFLSRKLYPNVDFYSGLIYQAMGYPPNMFTVLFALGRLPGWIAHWREMITDPATKIGRPRQVYTGPTHATTCSWPTADDSAVRGTFLSNVIVHGLRQSREGGRRPQRDPRQATGFRGRRQGLAHTNKDR